MDSGVDPDTPFAGLVKRRRLLLGMSQAALADLVGRSASAIRSWERGASTPSDEDVVRSLAVVLGIEEASLRVAVGLSPQAPAEEPDEVGGAALAGFMEEGTGEVGGPREPGVVDDTDGEGIPVDEIAEPDTASPQSASIAEVQVLDLASPGEDAASVTEDATDEGRPKPDRIPVPPSAGVQVPRPEPVGPAAAAVTAPTATIPISESPVQPVAASYLDDPDQMMTYWIRAALTVAMAAFLLIVLFWALGRLGESIGEVWDIFKAGS